VSKLQAMAFHPGAGWGIRLQWMSNDEWWIRYAQSL